MYIPEDEQQKLREELKNKSVFYKVGLFLWIYLIVFPIILVYNIFFRLFHAIQFPFQVIFKLCKNKCRLFKKLYLKK